MLTQINHFSRISLVVLWLTSLTSCKPAQVSSDATLLGQNYKREVSVEVFDGSVLSDVSFKISIGYYGGCGDHDFTFTIIDCSNENNQTCHAKVVDSTNDTCKSFIRKNITIPTTDIELEKGTNLVFGGLKLPYN